MIFKKTGSKLPYFLGTISLFALSSSEVWVFSCHFTRQGKVAGSPPSSFHLSFVAPTKVPHQRLASLFTTWLLLLSFLLRSILWSWSLS